jgi:hypothetical protein
LKGCCIYTESIIQNVSDRAKFDPAFRENFAGKTQISREESIAWLNKQSAEDLLVSNHGDPNEVWDWKILLFQRSILTLLYLLGLPFFCLAIMSGVQAAYLSEKFRDNNILNPRLNESP